jgi:hypothetical protein
VGIMTRTLKRKVIIRETDYAKVKHRAFMPIGVDVLYDRAEWRPLTRENIERDMIMRGLKGEQMPRGGSWLIPETISCIIKTAYTIPNTRGGIPTTM